LGVGAGEGSKAAVGVGTIVGETVGAKAVGVEGAVGSCGWAQPASKSARNAKATKENVFMLNAEPKTGIKSTA